MANDALKSAAQKELLRRQAQAELARREAEKQKASPQQASPQRPDTWADTLYRMTPMGVAKDLYGAAKDPMSALQKIDDSARMLANGASFGYADKLAGYMNGTGTEAERDRSGQAKQRLGTTGDALEILGSVLPATKAAQLGVTASNIPGMVGKYGGMILDGAAYGALDAAGHDQSILKGAGIGGLFGLLGQTVKTGTELAYPYFNKTPVPSQEELKRLKDAKFAIVDAEGAKYTPEQLAALNSGIADDMAAAKAHPVLNPKVTTTQGLIAEDLSKGPMTVSELNQSRRIIGKKIFDNAPTKEDARLGGMLYQNFDEFMDSTPLEGASDNAVKALKEGNDLHKRLLKLKMLDAKAYRSEVRAASSGSGGNADNAMRQRIADVLIGIKEGKIKNFTKDEVAQMENIVFGTGTRNSMRLLGKLSPQGNGLMAALGIGGAMVNPVLGVPAMAGVGAKMAADRGTRKAVQGLFDMIQAGQKITPKTMTPAQQKALEQVLMGGVRAGSAGLLGTLTQ